MDLRMLIIFSRQYLFLPLFADAQIIPDLVSECPFRLAFMFFDIFLSIFEHFFYFLAQTRKCSKLILYFSSPSPGIKYFFKELCFFVLFCYCYDYYYYIIL